MTRVSIDAMAHVGVHRRELKCSSQEEAGG